MPEVATRHVEHVMGTVFSLDVRGHADLGEVVRWLHWVDETFSTYREGSDISRLGRGELELGSCAPEVAEVLGLCAEVERASDGYFTTRPNGVLDPSALVKGWSVEGAARLLRTAGASAWCLNGGGDVLCGGEPEPGRPWRVGVADPLRAGALATVVTGSDMGVATSGVAERGCHIVDPHTGEPPTGLAGITVVGPSLTLADAYATGAFAMAGGARDWGARDWVAGLPGYEAFAVRTDGSRWWTSGWSGTT